MKTIKVYVYINFKTKLFYKAFLYIFIISIAGWGMFSFPVLSIYQMKY